MSSCRKFLALIVVLAMPGLSALSPDAGAADKDDIKPWPGELPVREPWLREHLPEDALIYLRLPHPLGFFAIPKGNAMDSALRNTANIKSIQKIQSALIENVIEHVPGFEEAYVRDFAKQLQSPVEFALMLSPTPSVLISLSLSVDSAEAFSNMIDGVSIGGAPLTLLEPLDDDGFGQILGLPVPASVHFDAASGRMLLQAGPSVAIEPFATQFAALQPATSHAMHAMEQQIDSSGYGWLFWVDAESAVPAATMFMDPEQVIQLQETGLDKLRAAAFGWGTANEKGRLSVIVDMPRDGERQFLPYVNNKVSATSVGEPDALVVLSIPTADEFMRIESLVLESLPEESRSEWLNSKEAVAEASGIRIENVLNAIGPEIVGIFDQAGDYAAIRLRDPKLFEEFVEQVAAISGSVPVAHRHKGHTFYHWSISDEIESLGADSAEQYGPLAFILSRRQDHVHWYRDGEFLYLASVPQPLIDRVDAGADTDLAAWLRDKQKLNLSTSVLAATGSSNKLPRRLYYLYLETLQALADISEADFDVWSMPTAAQVGLPDKGALGLSVNLGDPYLSLELMFENNPFESLFSGDMTSVAAIGIIAAIAIPAYQDYTIRASISQGINEATPTKAAIEAHFHAGGEFPGPTAAADISAGFSATGHASAITVVPGAGLIIVSFGEDTLPDGGRVYLEPILEDDGSLSWRCSANINDKLLPGECRENVPPGLEQGGT